MEARTMNPGATLTALDLAPKLAAAEARAAELERALMQCDGTLRMIRSDRPTAHSDDIWEALNRRINEIAAFTAGTPTAGKEAGR